MTGATSTRHWARHAERGNLRLMRLTAWGLRLIGRRGLRPIVYLIVLYFFAFSAAARANIREYQQRLTGWNEHAALQPGWRSVFAQFMAFGDSLLDKLDAWQGRLRWDTVTVDDPHGLAAQMQSGRGQILIGAHLGNLEVCRALAERGGQCRLNVLVHTRHAEQFNRVLRRLDPGSTVRLLQVTEVDAATAVMLAGRVDAGEFVAIAADRIPVSASKTARVSFLGHPAHFPVGAYVLAALLRCPVFMMGCVRETTGHVVRFEPLAEQILLPRGRRDEALAALAARFAAWTETLLVRAPYDWFNFFSFWAPVPAPAEPRHTSA